MEWFALFAAVAALAIASGSEAKATKLAKRVASLEELCMRLKAKDDSD